MSGPGQRGICQSTHGNDENGTKFETGIMVILGSGEATYQKRAVDGQHASM